MKKAATNNLLRKHTAKRKTELFRDANPKKLRYEIRKREERTKKPYKTNLSYSIVDTTNFLRFRFPF